MPTSFKLPALRSLGELADHAPTIVIDTREQNPLVFSRLQSVRETLSQLATIRYKVYKSYFRSNERASGIWLAVAWARTDSGLKVSLHRLRGFRFKRLLIVGSRGEIERSALHSRIGPKVVLGSLAHGK